MENEQKKDVVLESAKGLVYCANSQEIYCEILNVFCEMREASENELRGFLEAKDWKNYTIKVHALKNNAKSIGASSLGELCYELELAGKRMQAGEGETETLINEKHSNMLLVFDRTVVAAKEYMKKG